MNGLCVVAALLVAQSPGSELDQALALLDRLDATPIVVEYRQELIQDVLDDLSARLNVPMRAEWPAMLRLGIHHDDRITLKLNPTTAATVLGALSLTMGDEFERPVFEVHAGQLVLTSVGATAAMRLTAAYDVRDLLADTNTMQQLQQLPTHDAIESTKQSKPNETPSAAPPKAQPPRTVDHPPDHPPAARPNPFRAKPLDLHDDNDDDPIKASPEPGPPTPGEQLYMLITDHVDPDAWINFGGDRARVSDRNGVLMITATPTTHRRFKQALDALRRANPQSIVFEAAIVDIARQTFDRLSRQYQPNTAALAASIRADEATTTLWRTSGAVAIDRSLQVQSSAGDIAIQASVSPHYEKGAGLLRVDVEITARQGDDVRSIKTSAAMPGDAGALVLELPAAKPADVIRLVVLTPQRR